MGFIKYILLKMIVCKMFLKYVIESLIFVVDDVIVCCLVRLVFCFFLMCKIYDGFVINV